MKFSNLQKIPAKIINYLKEVREEMRKVTWPTRKETFRYTFIVIGISFVVSVFLGAFDYIFSFILRRFIAI